jgi:flagellar hook-associated protein 1
MSGLLGALNLGVRSLNTHRLGAEVAGQNLANVHNPAHARQRLAIETGTPAAEMQGGGADARVVQLRSSLLDRQIQSEASVRGSLQAQEQALDLLQSSFGRLIDRTAGGAIAGAAGPHGIGEHLGELFNAFQNLANAPASAAERQVVLGKAELLATQFNHLNTRLSDLADSLNETVRGEVDQSNRLLADIARLNEQIVAAEAGGARSANELRDLRQQKLEQLAERLNFSVSTQPNGAVDVSVGGHTLVSGATTIDRLAVYDAGAGKLFLRTQTGEAPVLLAGGSIHGNIETRDGALAKFQQELNTLASELIEQVNAAHRPGYSLTGSTGENFFTGTDAGSIRVNAALLANPALIQASGEPGAAGDNTMALALAQLGNRPLGALGNQTFSQFHSGAVTGVGQALESIRSQAGNQSAIERMLMRQRESISGVSLDEEMTDLIKYQKAFAASARLISTIDQMLETVVNLK